MFMITLNHIRAFALMVAAAGMLSACDASNEASPETLAPVVSVTTVTPRTVEIKDILPGRVKAYRTAEIRPQVSGIIQKRLFDQGSEVTQGQILFQINPAPFEADERYAKAALDRAEATLERAHIQTTRLEPLVASAAVSKQTYDDAVAAEKQAQADVDAAKAVHTRKRLDVGFAALASPLSGRIDQAMMTEGALATAGETTPMALVQQIDKVFVDVRQPVAQFEKTRKTASTGKNDKSNDVTLLASDGSAYPLKGTLLFSGTSVDPSTGDVLVRILVENTDRTLLPGMYVQAALTRLKIQDALTVPQQAVAHAPTGEAQVYLVDENGQAKAVTVQTGAIDKGWYVISSGLKAGDQIIVEGRERIMPDVPVKTIPWQTDAAPAVPSAPSTGGEKN